MLKENVSSDIEQIRATYRMRPCMNTDFMAAHELLPEKVRILDDPRAHNEERRVNILLREIVQKLPI